MQETKAIDSLQIYATKGFQTRLRRTTEWLGGVNYKNLELVLGKIKDFLSEDPNEEIHLLVSSYGGATGIGMSFYDAMKWLGANLVTIGSGDVDSSGILIFLSGKKRYLTQNTTLLLHLAGRTFEEEKRFSTAEMDSMLKEDKIKDYQYACVVADGTGNKCTPEKILELMSSNTILTAEEALGMGLAHGIF